MPALNMVLHSITGATVTAVAGAVLPDVLTEMFSVSILQIAFYGGLGGLTRWVFLRDTFRDGLRLVCLGVLLAAGVGVMWSVLLKMWVGDIPDHIANDPDAGKAGAYLIGLLAVAIIGRFVVDPRDEEGNG